MLAADLFSISTGITQNKLSREQLSILDAGLFAFICEELRNHFAKQYTGYLCLLKITNQTENQMLEEPLAKCIVKDIISSGLYTLSGIAYYTHTTEDVLFDIASGQNRDPSTTLFSKIIKLHQSVRPELYREILKKILNA